jgi:enterobacterial common antigen flippase
MAAKAAVTTDIADATLAQDAAVRMPEPTDRSRLGTSYGQILYSSALIGGSAALNLAVGALRTKAMAMLLGPAGLGLMGALTAITDLARSLAQLGVNSSGVRQIAESVSTGDTGRVAKTAAVLRRVSVVLALLGAIGLVLLCMPIASFTFGSDRYAGAVALLSLAVAFRLLSEGQGALLQGMRRIGDLAKSNVLGTLLGTAISVPLVYWLREDGVALALVAIAAVSLCISAWYSRRIPIDRVSVGFSEVRREGAELLRLGVAFMVSGILMMGAAYVVRIIVLRLEGLDAAGLYQAAWTVGGMYVGFILQAMGTDFYPRLVGASRDNSECNRLVNEQAEVSLLLAGPGVVATLLFAPQVVTLFYSSAFAGSVDLLRWICVGIALRVVSWPMGFIILARNNRTAFILTELAWATFNVLGTWFAVRLWGLPGAGIAFFASYVFHVAMIRCVVGAMTGFRWSRRSVWLMVPFMALTALVLVATLTLNPVAAASIGLGALAISTIGSAYGLCTMIPQAQRPRRVQQLFVLAHRLVPKAGGSWLH